MINCGFSKQVSFACLRWWFQGYHCQPDIAIFECHLKLRSQFLKNLLILNLICNLINFATLQEREVYCSKVETGARPMRKQKVLLIPQNKFHAFYQSWNCVFSRLRKFRNWWGFLKHFLFLMKQLENRNIKLLVTVWMFTWWPYCCIF